MEAIKGDITLTGSAEEIRAVLFDDDVSVDDLKTAFKHGLDFASDAIVAGAEPMPTKYVPHKKFTHKKKCTRAPHKRPNLKMWSPMEKQLLRQRLDGLDYLGKRAEMEKFAEEYDRTFTSVVAKAHRNKLL